MIYFLIILIIFLVFLLNSIKDTSKESDELYEIYSKKIKEGIVLLNLEKHSEALIKFKEAINNKPSNLLNSEPYYYLGMCYYGIGDYKNTLSYNTWKDKETELYFKAMSYLKLNDKINLRRYIYLGKKINFEKFDKIIDNHFNLRNNIDDFLFFIDENILFQIIRNIEEEDLIVKDNEIIWLLNSIKSAIQEPNGINMKYKLFITQLKYNDAVLVLKNTNLDKLFNKKYLYLNETKRSGKYNNNVAHNKFFISDLSFIKYFSDIIAINLHGQTQLNHWEILGKLPKLTELNIGKTNIKSDFFSKNSNLKIISSENTSLEMFSEYKSIEEFKTRTKERRIRLDKISEYIKKQETSSYPKFFYPPDFANIFWRIDSTKILQPKYDYQNKIKLTKGFTETYFFNQLKRQFSDLIHDNVYFDNVENYLPKFPDIALIDYENKIFIDIEIDEPYSFKSEDPTHYIGYDNDRNFDFLYENWFIIRFTEKQAIKHTHDCIKYISQVHRKIILCLNESDKITDFDFSNKEASWNKEDSIRMKNEKYRTSYLNKLDNF